MGGDVRERPSVAWTRRHLLGLEQLSRDEIVTLLDTAERFVENSDRRRKKRTNLAGRVVVNLFFEPSTRTRTSFSLAARRLGADVLDFSPSGFSTSSPRLDRAKPDLLLLAPGPINRGVTNRLAVRMAILFLLSGQPGGDA